jgi:hypothetical protein
MKIQIIPEYDENNAPHYFYKATMPDGTELLRAGHSWHYARGRMISAIMYHKSKEPTPQPEEIEV